MLDTEWARTKLSLSMIQTETQLKELGTASTACNEGIAKLQLLMRCAVGVLPLRQRIQPRNPLAGQHKKMGH